MKKSILVLSAAFLLVSQTWAEGPFKAGDNATDFSLKSVKGELVSLSDIENTKGFIVVFTSNVCPVAKKYEQRVIDLHKEFEAKGYPVVAINSNDPGVNPGDSFEEMKKVASDKGYTFTYLRDESQNVAKSYGATNTPHVYVLSKNGENLKVEYVGAIDNNADDATKADKTYVSDAVNSLLKGDNVTVTNTKAIGCSIKWKSL
jgi:peroxiredoxin